MTDMIITLVQNQINLTPLAVVIGILCLVIAIILAVLVKRWASK